MATVFAVIGAWRRRIRRPPGALRVVAAVVAAGALSLGATSAAAATVSPDSVSVVSDPGVTLSVPADGRLRGDHLAATVTGVAFPSRVGTGGSSAQAAAGQRLVVFGLQGAHLGQTGDAAGKAIPPVTGTVVVDGQRSTLPAPNSDDGTTPVYYRASVPASARDVSLELAASGLAQIFSLTQRARVGPQPVVLYRDRQTWQPLVQVNAEQDLITPDPVDQLPGATLPIRVRDVYLSWFGPDSPADVPASMDQAWLVLDATSQDDSKIGTQYLHYLSGLSADEVTVALPGAKPMASQLFNPGTGEKGVGVFVGIYAFTVPADVSPSPARCPSAEPALTPRCGTWSPMGSCYTPSVAASPPKTTRLSPTLARRPQSGSSASAGCSTTRNDPDRPMPL